MKSIVPPIAIYPHDPAGVLKVSVGINEAGPPDDGDIVVRLESSEHGVEEAWQRLGVVVEEQDVRSSHVPDPEVDGAHEPKVLVGCYDFNSGECSQPVGRVIRACVVDHQHASA
jgi:hypothetical protein